MDFCAIRPKPPTKKEESPRPQPPSAPAQPQPPPPAGPPAPPQYPPSGPPPLMEEMDNLSRMHRLRTVEYTNARTWRMNFGDHDQPYYYYNNGGYNNNYHGYSHQQNLRYQRPFGALQHHNSSYDCDRHMLPAPPPEYHHQVAPWQQPPQSLHYYHRQPYYGGGMFSDENPNACVVM